MDERTNTCYSVVEFTGRWYRCSCVRNGERYFNSVTDVSGRRRRRRRGDEVVRVRRAECGAWDARDAPVRVVCRELVWALLGHLTMVTSSS